MKLSRDTPRPCATVLRLRDYLDPTLLHAAQSEIPSDPNREYSAFGSTEQRTGVLAGVANETDAEFDDVLADYAALGDAAHDMQKVASFRLKTGILDKHDERHRIEAYLELTQGNPDELATALFVFGHAGLGLRIPQYALEQSEWTVQYGIPPIAGHHYVTAIGRSGDRFEVVSWGRRIWMTEGFYRRYCEEALVYLPLGFLDTNPPGFDYVKLRKDLKAFVRK